MCFPCELIVNFVFCVTTNLILKGIISCQRSVFKAITCSERIIWLRVKMSLSPAISALRKNYSCVMQRLISLFSRCTGRELVFLWQKHNRYRIRLLFDLCISRKKWNFISIIISREHSDSLVGRFSDVTGKCFSGAYAIDKIFNALFLRFYFSATWPSSNELIELGMERTNVKFGTLHLR